MPLAFIVTTALALLAAAPPVADASTPRLETLGRDRVVDALKRSWRPTTAVRGGKVITTRKRIRGTASQRLYRAAREGVTQYTRRVPGNGTYAVNLYVAEIANKAPGRRVFDVLAQGQPVATGVDVAAAVGRNRAHHVVFTTIVTDRVLRLAFRGRVGKPLVSSVEVTRMSPSTAPPAVRWGDEFEGPARRIDGTKWEYDVGVGTPPGWGSKELQTYTLRSKNVAVNGAGALAISAYPEKLAWTDGHERNYTSARVETAGRFAFTHGLLEARVKMPSGRGIWPAIWAVGDDIEAVGWPRSGELDVAEILNSDPSRAWASIHGPGAGQPYRLMRSARVSGSLADDFHVYGALRVPGAIKMLLDGRPYATFSAADLAPRRQWVFDKPFRLLLNVAVGGLGADKAPDASTPWPATMLVDYVRVSY